MMQRGTFRKLPDGSWGANVEGLRPTPGDTVELIRRDGSVRETVIGAVGDEGPYGWASTIAYVENQKRHYENDGDYDSIHDTDDDAFGPIYDDDIPF